MSIFLNDWSEEYLGQSEYNKQTGIEQMMDDFDINKETLEGVRVILASYTYVCYSGEAYVLFQKDGKYYEVIGNHCSCYGLEGQWSPEEVSFSELERRIETDDSFDGCREEMQEVIKQIKMIQ